MTYLTEIISLTQCGCVYAYEGYGTLPHVQIMKANVIMLCSLLEEECVHENALKKSTTK